MFRKLSVCLSLSLAFLLIGCDGPPRVMPEDVAGSAPAPVELIDTLPAAAPAQA